MTYAHELGKGVVNPSTMGQEERASGTEIVEEEQFLLLQKINICRVSGILNLTLPILR